MHFRDLGMLREEFRNDHRVLALALHANAERFHPANQQVGRFGIQRAAEVDDVVAHFVDDGAAAGGGACDQVGMS